MFVLQRGRRQDPIRIQLQNYPVTRRPDYTALSFAWGNTQSPTSFTDIIVAGKHLRVTKTFVTALQAIRLVDRDRIMWADQVCIDQGNIAEKTQQVAKMSIIYPQASEVLCWLGKDDGDVAYAFDVIRMWAAAHGPGKRKEKLRNEAAAEAIRQLSQDRRAHDALEKLFEKDWWRRAWILQEVCPSATNRPILICGEHQLRWYDFYHACFAMFRTLSGGERNHAFSSAVTYVLPMLKTSWADVEALRLSRLVPTVAKREAGDPRDKIFALLGMTSRVGLRYPPADYTLTANQVCVKYTRAIINVDRCLDILFSVANNRPNERLPTWAIKLDRLVGESYRMDGNAGADGTGRYRYKATRHQPPIVDPANGDFDPVLRLAGAPIDVVQRVFPIEVFINAIASGQQDWSNMLDRMTVACRSQGFEGRYAATGGSALEAMLETLTLRDFYPVRIDPQGEYRQQWDALFASYQRHIASSKSSRRRFGSSPSPVNRESLEAYAQQLCTFKRSGEESRREFQQAATRRKDGDAIAWLGQKAVADLLSTIRENSTGRRMFVTSSGFIGMGPWSARQGDRICLLFGASTPFMLRPVQAQFGRAYELVDEVYCEGFMMGEGLNCYVGRDGALRPPPGGWPKYALV